MQTAQNFLASSKNCWLRSPKVVSWSCTNRCVRSQQTISAFCKHHIMQLPQKIYVRWHKIFFAKRVIVLLFFPQKLLWERQISCPHFRSFLECLLRFGIFAKLKIANILSCQLQKSFLQSAQKKSKNLFVRPQKKRFAFSNKENDDVAQKAFLGEALSTCCCKQKRVSAKSNIAFERML